MSEYPHTVESVARVLGRIDLHLAPAGRVVPLPYGIETCLELGFSSAQTIFAFPGEVSVGSRAETLAKFGHKRGRTWLLDPPCDSNRALWRRFLKTDTPVVIESPKDPNWVSNCLRRLWRPIIYYTGSSALSEGTIACCRKYLAAQDGLLIATSSHMDSLSLFGRGELFDRALEESAIKAPDVWGYSDKQRVDILRGSLRLFKPKLV